MRSFQKNAVNLVCVSSLSKEKREMGNKVYEMIIGFISGKYCI